VENIPIHLLHAFVRFAEAKNINEAAKTLGITQPALSKQLQLLEAALPGKVFMLSGRKKVLTPFGQALHKQIKDRIGNLQEIVNQAWAMHTDPRQAKIRISARRGVLDRISSKVKFPGSLFFLESSNEQTIASTLGLSTQIGIAHSFPETHDLVAKPLFMENFQLAIPKNFLTQRPALGNSLFAKLEQIPCIGYKPEDELLQALCRHYGSELRNLHLVRTTENYSSISEMVEAKFGWAILPSYIKAPEKAWTLPIQSHALPRRQFFLLYQKEFAAIPWFKHLLAEIRTCFDVK
jgi:LysR family cyn operon transcriptional activator